MFPMGVKDGARMDARSTCYNLTLIFVKGPKMLFPSLEWSRVDTDSPSFAVVLTNQDRVRTIFYLLQGSQLLNTLPQLQSVLPSDIVIAQWVDGTRLHDSIRAPHGGFPTGDNFRVNLVQDSSDTSTIFAQSSEFSIHW